MISLSKTYIKLLTFNDLKYCTLSMVKAKSTQKRSKSEDHPNAWKRSKSTSEDSLIDSSNGTFKDNGTSQSQRLITELISHITVLEKKNKALKKKVRKESSDLDDRSREHQVQKKNMKIDNEASLKRLSSEKSDNEESDNEESDNEESDNEESDDE